jgi:hypothetical protein
MSRIYAICNTSNDLDKIKFAQVVQTTANTVRRSVNGTQFVLSWTIEPTFIADSTVIPEEILNHDECIELMATPFWSQNEDE